MLSLIHCEYRRSIGGARVSGSAARGLFLATKRCALCVMTREIQATQSSPNPTNPDVARRPYNIARLNGTGLACHCLDGLCGVMDR